MTGGNAILEQLLIRQRNRMKTKTLFLPYFKNKTTLVAKRCLSFNLITLLILLYVSPLFFSNLFVIKELGQG